MRRRQIKVGQKMTTVLGAIALSMLLSACTGETKQSTADTANRPTTEQDIAAIEQLYQRYRDVVEEGSIPGYLSVLHPDVRLLPPGAEPIVGAEKYGSFLQPVFASATYDIEVKSYPYIEVAGDAATAEYDYVVNLSLKNPSEGISEPGALTASRTRSRYFDVLLRGDDGQWSIWRHTWNVIEQE